MSFYLKDEYSTVFAMRRARKALARGEAPPA